MEGASGSCYDTSQVGSELASEKGLSGNRCHVECSNRGKCNYKNGLCQCFDGHYGAACQYTKWHPVFG